MRRRLYRSLPAPALNNTNSPAGPVGALRRPRSIFIVRVQAQVAAVAGRPAGFVIKRKTGRQLEPDRAPGAEFAPEVKPEVYGKAVLQQPHYLVDIFEIPGYLQEVLTVGQVPGNAVSYGEESKYISGFPPCCGPLSRASPLLTIPAADFRNFLIVMAGGSNFIFPGEPACRDFNANFETL